MIKKGDDNTTIINLSAGEYSFENNGEIFPIVLPDNVHLIGDERETTILDANANQDEEDKQHAVWKVMLHHALPKLVPQVRVARKVDQERAEKVDDQGHEVPQQNSVLADVDEIVDELGLQVSVQETHATPVSARARRVAIAALVQRERLALRGEGLERLFGANRPRQSRGSGDGAASALRRRRAGAGPLTRSRSPRGAAIAMPGRRLRSREACRVFCARSPWGVR